jgi:hypothetical protein
MIIGCLYSEFVCTVSHLVITINTKLQTMETNPKMIILVQCEFNESSSFLDDCFKHFPIICYIKLYIGDYLWILIGIGDLFS